MALIVQEPNLIRLKDVKFGQMFKIQSYTTNAEGKYFVKARDTKYIPAQTLYISLKNFYACPFDEDALVYLIDADIIVKGIIPQGESKYETDN